MILVSTVCFQRITLPHLQCGHGLWSERENLEREFVKRKRLDGAIEGMFVSKPIRAAVFWTFEGRQCEELALNSPKGLVSSRLDATGGLLLCREYCRATTLQFPSQSHSSSRYFPIRLCVDDITISPMRLLRRCRRAGLCRIWEVLSNCDDANSTSRGLNARALIVIFAATSGWSIDLCGCGQ
jgi:hypothetical protein